MFDGQPKTTCPHSPREEPKEEEELADSRSVLPRSPSRSAAHVIGAGLSRRSSELPRRLLSPQKCKTHLALAKAVCVANLIYIRNT